MTIERKGFDVVQQTVTEEAAEESYEEQLNKNRNNYDDLVKLNK